MKISFVDFWPKFNPNNNFFLHLLRDMKEDVQVVYPEDSEILLKLYLKKLKKSFLYRRRYKTKF